ncbi:MAG: SMC family ATPase [Candidatus Woesearchaeota archaeon]
MILKSIRLKNIRSYQSQSIGFPEGPFLLSGDIGSGKSTILLAAEFALFGIMRGELTGENLLRHGAKEGSVELKFEADGSDIIIKRNLKRGRDSVKQESGHLIMDGKKTEGTHIELKTRVLDILGYPKELLSKSKSLIYRYTVYTPQEQMKQILFEDREARLDILRKVFGIDKYKRIAENSQIITRVMRERAKELQGKAEGIEEKKKEAESKRKEADDTGKKLDDVRKRLEAAAGDFREKERIVPEKEKKVKELQEMRKELEISQLRLNEKADLTQKNRREAESLTEQINDLKKRISALQVKDNRTTKEIEEEIRKKDLKIKDVLEKRSELTEKKKYIGERLQQIRKEQENASEQLKGIEDKEKRLKELKEMTAKKDGLRKELRELEEGINESDRKLSEAEAMRKSSEQLIDKVSKMDNCPTCLQPVTKEHKHKISRVEDEKIRQSKEFRKQLERDVEGKKKRVEELNRQLEDIHEKEKEREKLESELHMLKRMKDDSEKKGKELETLNKDLSKTKEKLEELNREDMSSLSKEMERDKEMLKRLQDKAYMEDSLREKENRLQEINASQEEIKKDVAEINRRKMEITRKIDSMKGAEEAYNKAKKELEEAREKQKKLELEEKGLSTQKENLDNLIKNIDKEIKHKTAARESLHRMNALKEWLEKTFLGTVDLVEKNVMYKVHTEFRELFRQWFNVLLEDETMAINLDESFTPVIEQDGYETSINALSGGEKTAIALAYRLALNKVINDVVGSIKTKDLIILDEPTDGFSSEQLEKVRDVLDELDMRQVIIVSHEPKVEGFVDNVIRIQKSGHVSSVV